VSCEFGYRPGVDIPVDEDARVASLLDAQANAAALFDAVDHLGLIAPGVCEITASDAIRDLANEMFGGTRHWHKRIVRAGSNTLLPYRKNPPDRVIASDDVVFCDFGPIFDGWEADFGRTFVLGDDPVKHRLCADLPAIFEAGRQFYEAHQQITGEQLFDYVVSRAEDRGWAWGGTIAGHLVGEFPHDEIEGDDIYSAIAPGNDRAMRTVDSSGNRCHWILEIHLVDIARQFGGFHEQLLDIGH
jgi:Xaa-Pro aminopeptidase